MEVKQSTTPSMTFTPPKIGVVPTPPKRNEGISRDTLEIASAQAPKELKEAGVKKPKGPINLINYLWLGVGAISATISIQELIKLIKK